VTRAEVILRLAETPCSSVYRLCAIVMLEADGTLLAELAALPPTNAEVVIPVHPAAFDPRTEVVFPAVAIKLTPDLWDRLQKAVKS
jgi:hypothetical protein